MAGGQLPAQKKVDKEPVAVQAAEAQKSPVKSRKKAVARASAAKPGGEALEEGAEEENGEENSAGKDSFSAESPDDVSRKEE